MALTSIQKDFIVKNGIVVQGNSAITSSTAQSSAFQSNGGVAVAKNLIVGTTSTLFGAVTLYNDIFQPSLSTGGILFADSTGKYSQDAGLSYDTTGAQLSATNITGGVITATSNLYVTGTDGASSADTGALQITGGVGVGGGLYVSADVTATNFYGNVYASNTSTMIVGFASTAGYALNFNTGTLVTTAVTVANTSGFVVGFASTAGYALNFNTGTLVTTAVNLAGGSTGAIVYQSGSGATTFLNPSSTTGAILASGGTGAASSYVTQVTASASGTASYTAASGQSLVVSSNGLGVTGNSYFANNLGIGGNIYIAGDMYVDGTQFVVNKEVISSGDSALVLSTGSTSAALAQGAGLYIGATSSTAYASFTYDGSANWVTGGANGGGLKVAANTGASSTNTGALQVVNGGIGVGGGGYFGASVTATNFYGNVYANNTSTMQVGYAANVLGGSTGSLVYQSSANTTALLPAGTDGYILEMVAGLPSWQSISALAAGNATTATNLAGGTAGQTPYQTAPGATSFYGPGTAGQLLVSGGTSGPSYTNTGSIYVGFASTSTYAGNIGGGTAGQLVYQTGGSATDFVGPGTAGQILVSAGAAVPVYTSTGSIYVGYAANTNNIIGGTTGQVPYQTGAGATGFDSGFVYSTLNSGVLTVGGQVTINGTSATNAVAAGGALKVSGGVGISKDLYVGTTATINGNLYVGGTIYMQGVGLDTISSNTGTFVDVVSTGTITANNLNIGSAGSLYISNSLDYGVSPGSTATGIYYSVATQGGIKAAKNIIAGGVVSAGDFGGTGTNDPLSTDSGSRDGFYLLNNMQSARTITSVSGSTTVTIDSWSKNTYSSAKYIVQAVDGSKVFVAELMILQDGTNVYLSEYGIVYNNSVLGTFDGAISGSNVVISFATTGATSMTIQVVRQSILTAAESYAS